MNDRAGMRIMLLEDEPLIAMSTEQALEDLGYENVEVFYRLDPAVTAAEEDAFDVAILDVNVDQSRTSLDLARSLKKMGTAILFASGNSIDNDKLQAITDTVLSKPYTEDDLDAALGHVLSVRSP
jgi:DNA-binding response OmpR family regulator